MPSDAQGAEIAYAPNMDKRRLLKHLLLVLVPVFAALWLPSYVVAQFLSPLYVGELPPRQLFATGVAFGTVAGWSSAYLLWKLTDTRIGELMARYETLAETADYPVEGGDGDAR